MHKNLTQFLFLLACVVCSFPGLLAQDAEEDSKHQVAVRFIGPNYLLPIANLPSPLEGRESFGSGLAFEYQRRIAPNFLLGVPLQISSARAFRNEGDQMATTVNEVRSIRSLSTLGADLLLVLDQLHAAPFLTPNSTLVLEHSQSSQRTSKRCFLWV
ncbi:MAG: hypothetical protein HC821_05140 [Lewinella sp.]|nr:hypothetical protein [Lewinella sp.]